MYSAMPFTLRLSFDHTAPHLENSLIFWFGELKKVPINDFLKTQESRNTLYIRVCFSALCVLILFCIFPTEVRWNTTILVPMSIVSWSLATASHNFNFNKFFIIEFSSKKGVTCIVGYNWYKYLRMGSTWKSAGSGARATGPENRQMTTARTAARRAGQGRSLQKMFAREKKQQINVRKQRSDSSRWRATFQSMKEGEDHNSALLSEWRFFILKS